jgi:hydrogenase nickel incorporation protein HypB
MCATCGCEGTGARIHAPLSRHDHPPHSSFDGEARFTPLPPDPVVTRRVELEQDVLAKNDRLAASLRDVLRRQRVLALNLLSAPGAGKTALLERTIAALLPSGPVSVLEGDQETSRDAERVEAAGARALQINTGAGCHLDAAMVQAGLRSLAPPSGSLLFIENVGNLVCPALFDLGERAKVVLLSVTEGEDKPLKYPHAFRAARVLVLTKVDLLPHLDFDVERCLAYARQVNPHLEIFQTSARTGAGLDAWCAWIRAQHEGEVAA